MRRRDFVTVTAGLAASPGRALVGAGPGDASAARAYLRSLIPTRRQLEDFTRREQGPEHHSRNAGWTYDADLGWVLCDSIRHDGVDRSKTFYHYERDGARKVLNGLDRPCRIHTYGNSFTHCDQVSDGETWQEYLAGHLQEPIRNYGVGGYSVYQAYRRMRHVEGSRPGGYVILNVWDDDHYRNLDSWRSIRFGSRTPCGWPLPYLAVTVRENRCREIPNTCPQVDALARMCDEDFVWRTFKDDPVLYVVLAKRAPDACMPRHVTTLAARFGIPEATIPDIRPVDQIRHLHTEAALFATKHIVTWTEGFVARTGKKLMLILSFCSHNVATALQGRPRFDQTFVDWLANKPYPVIDMRDSFASAYKRFKGDVGSFLRQYYIGHHSPRGNFFSAWALKDRVVDWLKPPPLPYR